MKTNGAEKCDCGVIHEDTVALVAAKMPDKEEHNALAELFKLFADGTRVRVLNALEYRELCVCDLAVLLNMTKSAISHQLKLLRMSNLVKTRREGQVVFYALADTHVKDIIDIGFEHIHEG